MLTTYHTVDAAITAAEIEGATVVYKIGSRYTTRCTSGLCDAVAAKQDGVWIRKAS